MTPTQFLAWRKSLGWSRKDAAERLGLSASRLADYERGTTRGTDRPAPIPLSVALACVTLALGFQDYPTRSSAAPAPSRWLRVIIGRQSQDAKTFYLPCYAGRPRRRPKA